MKIVELGRSAIDGRKVHGGVRGACRSGDGGLERVSGDPLKTGSLERRMSDEASQIEGGKHTSARSWTETLDLT